MLQEIVLALRVNNYQPLGKTGNLHFNEETHLSGTLPIQQLAANAANAALVHIAGYERVAEKKLL